jgi:hypothetical protein
MTSGDSDAGPMVQTIRVLWAGRITKHPRYSGSCLIPQADVRSPPYRIASPRDVNLFILVVTRKAVGFEYDKVEEAWRIVDHALKGAR